MLAAQERGRLAGEPAEDDVGGVDDMPLTGDLRRLGGVGTQSLAFTHSSDEGLVCRVLPPGGPLPVLRGGFAGGPPTRGARHNSPQVYGPWAIGSNPAFVLAFGG
ncbi:hypothetical protein GCM10009811_32920 [Nostocoides veronense]|uniref:Uncharacterized protein n=1 Tax=Nostocoides veronense TaxID=330836 RepID=A0ABP4YE45_9MICO